MKQAVDTTIPWVSVGAGSVKFHGDMLFLHDNIINLFDPGYVDLAFSLMIVSGSPTYLVGSFWGVRET